MNHPSSSDSSTRRISRAAACGMALVLVAMGGFAIDAALRTSAAAERSATATSVADLYERARYAVGQEESLERKYRLEPEPENRAKYDAAAASLLDALRQARALDRDDERELTIIIERHRAYLVAIRQMFAAVDAHDTPLVVRIDGGRVDPSFGFIETSVDRLAEGHRDEAAAGLKALRASEHTALVVTPIVVVVGLALIATFGVLLIRHRRRAEKELVAAEARYRLLVETLPIVHYVSFLDEDLTDEYMGPQIEDLLGYSQAEWMDDPGIFPRLLHEEDRERVLAEHQRAAAAGVLHSEYRLHRKDGRVVWVLDNGLVEPRDPTRLRGYMIDITEKKEAEAAIAERDERLRQTQKLEAVGQLAGGIAHDFNNLLTAINGYAALLEAKLEPGSVPAEYVGGIAAAGGQAARLTSQLLAFSRKQVLQPTLIDLNKIVAHTTPMLRRLIGEDIRLVSAYEGEPTTVRADVGQLEQVILNLAVNARDAMPDGGILRIETAVVTLADNEAECIGAEPGRSYVRLRVSDTGVGMDEAVRARLFEPFFTTREQGKGTGLGLATVYGVVEQSSGLLDVTSAPGQGATFDVYLPHANEAPATAAETVEAGPSAVAPLTVMLVEDEELVRDLASKMLEEQGHRVIAARDGNEALAISRSHDEAIDLLVTDVVMPHMNGRELADTLLEERPGLRVLFVSGYTEDAVIRRGVAHGRAFLQKPFTPQELAHKLAGLLHEPPASVDAVTRAVLS